MDIKEFYITVFSNNSFPSFPKNTLSAFTNLLHCPKDVRENWKVGLKEIYFNNIVSSPRTKRELESDKKIDMPSIFIPQQLLHLTPFSNNDNQNLSRTIHVLEKEEEEDEEVENGNITKKAKFDSYNIPEQHVTSDVLINTPTIYIPNELMHLTPVNNSAIPLSQIDVRVAEDSQNSATNLDGVASVEAILDQDNHSDDRNVEQAKNDEVGFFLPSTLMETIFNYFYDHFFAKKILPSEENKTVLMFIYTDVMKPRTIGNQATRCLKIIPSNGKGQNIIFDMPEYYPIEQQTLRTLSIQIANDIGEKINFEPSNIPTYCVLHFIKEKL